MEANGREHPAISTESLPRIYKPVPSVDVDTDDALLPNEFWREVRLPTDFSAFNFAPAEDAHLQLVVLDDQWRDNQVGNTPTDIVDVPLCEMQVEIDIWRNAEQPIAHESILAVSHEYDSPGISLEADKFHASLLRGLGFLTKDANSFDAKCSTAGRDLWMARRRTVDGAKRSSNVRWAQRYNVSITHQWRFLLVTCTSSLRIWEMR